MYADIPRRHTDTHMNARNGVKGRSGGGRDRDYSTTDLQDQHNQHTYIYIGPCHEQTSPTFFPFSNFKNLHATINPKQGWPWLARQNSQHHGCKDAKMQDGTARGSEISKSISTFLGTALQRSSLCMEIIS